MSVKLNFVTVPKNIRTDPVLQRRNKMLLQLELELLLLRHCRIQHQRQVRPLLKQHRYCCRPIRNALMRWKASCWRLKSS